MGLFDNDDLIIKLLKYGSEFELKFGKYAQTQPAASPNYFSLTQKLVSNLEQSYFPKPKDANAISSGSDDSEVKFTVSDVNTWGNFLAFISSNKMMVGNVRIAYDSNPDIPGYLPTSGKIANYMEHGDRSAIKPEFYINKDLAIKYIQSLQHQAETMGEEGKVLKVMLGSRIDDLNKVFEIQLNKKYQEPEFELKDDDTLTSFRVILDQSDGDRTLRYKDIKTAGALQQWAKDQDVFIEINGANVSARNLDFNWCDAVRIIYNKAKLLKQNNVAEKKYDIFVKQIEVITPQLSFNDLPCSVSGTSSSAKQTNNKTPYELVDHKARDKDKPGSTTKNFAELIGKFPLFIDRIDFDRIRDFTQIYQNVTGEYSQYTSEIVQTVNNLIMSSGAHTQTLDATVDQISSRLKGAHPVHYLKMLYDLISRVSDMLTDFRSKYSDVLNGNQQLKQDLNKQIGSDPGDTGSFAHQNINKLTYLLSDASTWRR